MDPKDPFVSKKPKNLKSVLKLELELICGQASMLNMVKIIKISFKWENRKRCFFPFVPFTNDSKLNFQFKWHPHVGEIHMETVMDEKGGVIKHIKAPAVEIIYLRQNRLCDDMK